MIILLLLYVDQVVKQAITCHCLKNRLSSLELIASPIPGLERNFLNGCNLIIKHTYMGVKLNLSCRMKQNRKINRKI